MKANFKGPVSKVLCDLVPGPTLFAHPSPTSFYPLVSLGICVYVCACVRTCMHACLYVCLVMSDSLQLHGLWPTRLLCPRNCPGKKYWRGLPFPTPGDLLDSGNKPISLVSPGLAGRWILYQHTTWEVHFELLESESENRSVMSDSHQTLLIKTYLAVSRV